MTLEALARRFDRVADDGRTVGFWLRDDDAVRPTPALDRLLSLTTGVPLTLAVIPAGTGTALADRLAPEARVTVAVHGWAHENHAGAGRKKSELGDDRPLEAVCADLARGFGKLRTLHPERFLPMLVPPWNRIGDAVTGALPGLGFTAVSTFGGDGPGGIERLDTHVDLIDWHGTRSGRDDAALTRDIGAALDRGVADIGILIHHLVHDEGVWSFLARLIALTGGHPACRWRSAPDILAAPRG